MRFKQAKLSGDLPANLLLLPTGKYQQRNKENCSSGDGLTDSRLAGLTGSQTNLANHISSRRKRRRATSSSSENAADPEYSSGRNNCEQHFACASSSASTIEINIVHQNLTQQQQRREREREREPNHQTRTVSAEKSLFSKSKSCTFSATQLNEQVDRLVRRESRAPTSDNVAAELAPPRTQEDMRRVRARDDCCNHHNINQFSATSCRLHQSLNSRHEHSSSLSLPTASRQRRLRRREREHISALTTNNIVDCAAYRWDYCCTCSCSCCYCCCQCVACNYGSSKSLAGDKDAHEAAVSRSQYNVDQQQPKQPKTEGRKFTSDRASTVISICQDKDQDQEEEEEEEEEKLNGSLSGSNLSYEPATSQAAQAEKEEDKLEEGEGVQRETSYISPAQQVVSLYKTKEEEQFKFTGWLRQQQQQEEEEEEGEDKKSKKSRKKLKENCDHQKEVEKGETDVLVGDSPNEVMEILRNHTLEDRLTLAPKTYPNNTLLVDLNKCHRNITNFWPQFTQAHLLDNLKGCLTWRMKSNNNTNKSRNRKPKLNFQMPESILRTNIMLTLDDYDKALSVLTNDIRYQLHLLLYRRIHTIWILLTTVLCSVLPVLLTNLESLIVVGASCLWLALQIVGAFATRQFREKLDQMLERSVAQVNSFFMDHNLMLGVINTGSFLSKSKLIIPMLYFDTSQCREQIESIISIDSRKDADGNNNNNNNNNNSSNHTKLTLDYSKIGLPLQKPNIMAFAQSQLAKKTVLRYSQRWISYFDKQKLMFTDDRIRPRHLSTGKCLCQFIEEHFKNSDLEDQQQQQQQQQQQANSNQLTIAFTNNTKATQNGKNHSNAEQIQPQVMRKQHAINHVTAIPTLSGLVSLQDSPQHLTIDVSPNCHPNQVAQSHLHQQQLNGFTNGNLWGHLTLNVDQNQEPFTSTTIRTNISQTSTIQTPNSTSPEVSLEMGSDLISRSDELVRKLRLLLEIKKDELQGIDGSLFSSVLYRAPQPPAPVDILSSENGTTNAARGADSLATEISDTNSVSRGGGDATGKRFYGQREGLFFLGTNGAKKNQQQQVTNKNHVLEIC